LSPAGARALARRAATLERLGDTRGALAAWREALAIAPERADLWYGLSETLIDTFAPEESFAIARTGMARWPADPRFPLVAADALLHDVALRSLSGDARLAALAEALVQVRRARVLRRRHGIIDGELLVVEAQACLLSGDAVGAERKFRSALRRGLPLYVDRLEVTFNLGLLALQSGDWPAARDWFARLRRALARWRERHYYRLIPFAEYLWLIERAFLDHDAPLVRAGRLATLRDKRVYSAIRRECLKIRDALRRDDAAAAGEAADRLRAAMSQQPLAACLQFAVLKKPFLFEALNRVCARASGCP